MYHLDVEVGWEKVTREEHFQLELYKAQSNKICKADTTPKNRDLIAEVLRIFSSKILLQKNFNSNLSPIPLATKNFSKKPYKYNQSVELKFQYSIGWCNHIFH